MDVPGLGVSGIGAVATAYTKATGRQDLATSATYAVAHSNTGSLTH